MDMQSCVEYGDLEGGRFRQRDLSDPGDYLSFAQVGEGVSREIDADGSLHPRLFLCFSLLCDRDDGTSRFKVGLKFVFYSDGGADKKNQIKYGFGGKGCTTRTMSRNLQMSASNAQDLFSR